MQRTFRSLLAAVISASLVTVGLLTAAPAQAADTGWVPWSGPTGADAEAWVRTFTDSGSTVYAGTEGSGVFRSTNSGSTWSKFAGPLPSAEANLVRDIELNGPDVLAATSAGIFVAPAGGGSWSPKGSGAGANKLNQPVQTLLAAGSGRLLAGVVGGVYSSTDNGNTWLPVSGGLPDGTTVWSLDSYSYLPSTILAATSAGVFRSTNNGSSWEAVSDGLPTGTPVLRVMADQANPTRWFAATGGAGVFRSDNSGQSWKAVNSGLWNTTIRAIDQYTISGSHRLIIGTADGVYTSSNAGNTWQQIGNDGLGGKTIAWAVAPQNSVPGGLLVGTQGGGVHYRWTSPPVNTVAPTLNDTTPQVGQQLNTTWGTWTGTPSINYTVEWERCSSGGIFCDTIPGATSTSYVVTPADAGLQLRSVIRATNAASPPGYENTAAGNEPSALTSAVTNTAGLPSGPNPTITNGFGSPTVGQTLIPAIGSWTPSVTSTIFIWWRCNISKSNCTQVQANNTASYQLTAADAGWYMSVQARVTNAAGSSLSDLSAVSSQILPTQVSTVSKPVILGSAAPGQTLVRSLGTYSGPYENSFTTWQVCDTAAGAGCVTAAGAGNGASLLLSQAHLGKYVRVKVEIDVNGFNQTPATLVEYSAPVGPVAEPTVPVVPPVETPSPAPTVTPQPTPPPGGTVTQQNRPAYTAATGAITGKPKVGRKLTVRKGTWSGSPTFTYKWKRNGTVIKGAQGLRYKVIRKDKGRKISVVITARNAAGITKVTLPAKRIR